jgi:D-methionine transport system substrate-binding protein
MKKKLLAGLAMIPAIALLAGCASSPASGAASAPVTVKIGVADASSDYWPLLEKKALANGIDIKLVNFSDYNQANPALAQKQTDLNLFQHLQFLGTYNVTAHQNLTPIGATLVVPLGLYSTKYTSLKQIPKGGVVAIPNDPANLARGLNVLKAAGLVSFTGSPDQPTQADIDASKSRVTVTLVDAAQTVASLPSVAGAIINNNFVQDAKIDPKSALYKDDPSSPSAQPYINTFVSRAADKNNKTFAEIVRLYHSAEILKAVEASSKGTAVIVEGVSNAELQKVLDRVEKNIKASAN